MTKYRQKQIWDGMIKEERLEALLASYNFKGQDVEEIASRTSDELPGNIWDQIEIQEPHFKQNKWYNLGDVNPREHGGIFIRRIGNDIEVVSTDVDENNMQVYYDFDKKREGTNYIINSRSDYVDYLWSRWQNFKKGKDTAVGSFADWKRMVELEEKEGWPFERIVFYLVSDMMSYYGGSCESDYGSNYWDLLRMQGVTLKNFV